MTFTFNPAHGLVVVEAELVGPTTRNTVRLALDTASSGTIVDPVALTYLGYDLTRPHSHVQATTASGVIGIPRLPVLELSALGRTVTNLLVAAHRVPSTGIDGLLGLDFLRGQILSIDFHRGEIALTAGGPTP